MDPKQIVELAEHEAWLRYPDAEDVDVYEDAPGKWQVSVFGSSEHDGEWIHSVEIDSDRVELGMVS